MISATAEFGTSRFNEANGNSMHRTDVIVSFIAVSAYRPASADWIF